MPVVSFATPIGPGEPAKEALLLARSIRVLGGRLRDRPILALASVAPDDLAADIRTQLAALDIRIVPYAIGAAASGFPFAAKAYAAAAAEEVVLGSADLLIWLDSDTLVLQEPAALHLNAGKALACCPIHHMRIGPSFDAPLDPFWRLVYDGCGTSEVHAFLMHTMVDGDRIRPHLNAGLLGVRPERKLLRTWRDNFARLYREPAFQPFYQQNARYRIFAHQAILSATALALLAPDEFSLLPVSYNYPLHLHADYPAERAVACLDDLITCRYDAWAFLARMDWADDLRVSAPLRRWLEEGVS